MKLNLPVTQREVDYPAARPLVSVTDAQGRITHCNKAFVQVSGFDYDELLGQPHHLVRHPDMPPEAFKDMWSTIGRGRPWTGIVKNRCKNGDHYWVQANVTPVMSAGKPVGYMSVRIKPTREQVQQAEALYAQIKAERESGRQTLRLHAGGVRRNGWRDLPNRYFRLSMSARFGLALSLTLAAAVLPSLLGWHVAAQLGLAGAAGLGLLAWFRGVIAAKLDECTELAQQIAGCNLAGRVDYDMRHPLGPLTRYIWLTNLNMHAIVDDVRHEVAEIRSAAQEVAQGSHDLSGRTEEQSASVQMTASALEQISTAASHTADTARLAGQESEAAQATARRGGQAVAGLATTMADIEQATRRVQEVNQVIEDIAFQTNILALNAAVEAARAGEQGKGFGVVASEVRALARRAAESAREIRALVGSSVEHVERGGVRMQQTGTVIDDVLRSVERMGSMVRDISRVSGEQCTGIVGVSEAMTQIDQATQQNAALSEQAAAACRTMQQRADTLTRAVEIFDKHPA
ncbi:MAG: PAS domain-containing protein [Burkholderiaceae bacterium]|nr:PAS domain-containing protein [Burkholderiaceae bacterium]